MRKLPFMLCLVQMHAMVVVLMGLMCLIGRLLGKDVLVTWRIDSTGMAGSAAIAFIVLGLAVFFLAAKLQNRKNGQK